LSASQLCYRPHNVQLDAVLSIALDLTASLGAADRYARLLARVRQVIPCDAAALLRLEPDGRTLAPLAAHGLSDDALARTYRLDEHPRLAAICAADAPVLFSATSPLPDPFDGLLARDRTAASHVHACLGCPLTVEGERVGALTADALDPHAFDGIDRELLSFLGALAGAAIRTSRLIEALEQSAAQSRLVARELVRDARQREGGEIIGRSGAIEALRREIAIVAASDLSVLITGETGVGKELVARAIHEGSRLHDRPLIHVNCAALPESIAESELFGHVRGAFTGADADRPGKFEVARGGTILLDEIGELPLAVQPKLLRVLQEGEIQRVGADRPLRVDVRVFAATNRDLAAEVADGRFRADLYHRLAVYPVHVPALRERRDDIALLAGYFCDLVRRRLGIGPVRLAADARDALASYNWPGNVRELQNVVSRVALRCSVRARRGDPVVIAASDLAHDLAPAGAMPQGAPVHPVPAASSERGGGADASATSLALDLPEGTTLRDALRDYERALIRRAVERHGGNWSAAARSLGMHRSNLHNLAVRLGLR
jgi:anaerobic nitric oxide reductase transcription regulator